MDMTLLIGTLGAVLLLIGFALEQFGVIGDKSYAYDGLNVVGSGLLGWYAAILGSWPFIVLETIWALVAAYYVLRRLVGMEKNG